MTGGPCRRQSIACERSQITNARNQTGKCMMRPIGEALRSGQDQAAVPDLFKFRTRHQLRMRRGRIQHKRRVVLDLPEQQKSAVTQRCNSGQADACELFPLCRARTDLQCEIAGATQRRCLASTTPRSAGHQCASGREPRIKDELDRLGIRVPLIGDFHYIGHKLLADHPGCAEALAKYRINPGNVGFKEKKDRQFADIVEMAIRYGKPVRIGVNWGSLDQELLTRLMDENQNRLRR